MRTDVCVVTLRTDSGHALTSYGYCDLQLQVPPIEGAACVTFEVVDVRYPILSVAMVAANGRWVFFSRLGGSVEHGGRSCRAVDVNNSREFLLVDCGATYVMCARRLGLSAWVLRASSSNRWPR